MDQSPPDYCFSTQVQSNHEYFEEVSRNENKIKQITSSFQRFKNPLPSPPYEVKTISKTKKLTKPKIKSINSYVRDNLGPAKDARKERSSQLSILQYLSGDKKKVHDILRQIDNEEKHASKLPIKETNQQLASVEEFYSKEEWSEILKSIKLKFPDLSTRTKKTLKTITKRIRHHESQSIWDLASAHPGDDLDDNDLKWLYDLDDDQMNNDHSFVVENRQDEPFVMSLSQVFNEQKNEEEADEEEEEDEEDSPKLMNEDSEETKDNYDDTNDMKTSLALTNSFLGSSPQEIPNSSPDPEIIELDTPEASEVPTQVETITIPPHQAEEVDVTSSLRFNDPVVKNSIYGTSNLPIDLASDSVGEEIFSSVVSTPQKKRVTLSPFKSPLKRVLESPLSSDDEVFSTARTEEITYTTTTVDVRGLVEVLQRNGAAYKVRKLGEDVIDLDSDVEIGDSQDDENVSVIEVCVPVEDSETSILQVPSSPSDKKEAEHGFEKMTTSELRQKLALWGIKPVKSRLQMVNVLSDCSAIINSAPDADLTQEQFTEKFNDSISKAVRQNDQWFSKIISFEPIVLEELGVWLDQHFGVSVQRDLLQKFSDDLGVTTRQPEKEGKEK